MPWDPSSASGSARGGGPRLVSAEIRRNGDEPPTSPVDRVSVRGGSPACAPERSPWILLAVRWAIDQMEGPVGEQFIPAFLHALMALWVEMFTGLPAYLAAGIVLGSLLGLGIAEAIAACSRRIPAASSPKRGQPGRSAAP